MTEDFKALAPEYERLAATATIVPAREAELARTAEDLLKHKDVYAELAEKSTVPIAVLMALAEREMDGNLRCYLGNGEPLVRRTVLVPKGRGPFMQAAPENFIAGGLDALRLDGLDAFAATYGDWTLALLCYASEAWNGWGYRARGIPSPYVFGGTTVQRMGKFIRDGVFSSSVMDPQLGTLAIVEELVKQDSSLAFYDQVQKIAAPPIVPMAHPTIGAIDIARVQFMLNKIKSPGTPLLIDDNCGRATRAVVLQYQRLHHLVADGLPGPQTYASLLQSMAEAGM